MIGGRTVPNGVVLRPNDAQAIDLAKLNDEPNRFVASPFALIQSPPWGLARVVNEAITEGTALVGDFSKAILFERETVTIRYRTVGNDFLRNIVRVVAEGRWGFAIMRPNAFVRVTLARPRARDRSVDRRGGLLAGGDTSRGLMVLPARGPLARERDPLPS